MLPPKKRPYVPRFDIERYLQLEYLQGPVLPHSTQDAASHVPDHEKHLTSSSTPATASTSQGRQKQFEILRSNNIRLQREAYEQHRNTALTMKGRDYHSLDPEEVEKVTQAKRYIYTSKLQARKRQRKQIQDIQAISLEEADSLLKMLPTKFLVRQPPFGPLTKDQARRLKRAEVDRAVRHRKEAAAFMHKEFGMPPPPKPLRSGPKLLDLTALDPARARKIAKRRAYEARRKAESQGKVIQ